MEQWNNSTAVNCTIFQKCSTPSKVNGRGYLYRRPSLQTLGNAPTCSLTAKNIPGFWAFPGAWSVQIAYYYKITFLLCSQRHFRPSGSPSSRDLLHDYIFTKSSLQVLGFTFCFEGCSHHSCRSSLQKPSQAPSPEGRRRSRAT